MPELSVGYHATRRRITELIDSLDVDILAWRVPACPDWDVHDLIAHLSGVPESLAAGDRQAWLDGIVADRRSVTVDDLLDRWEACAEATSALVDGPGAGLFIDVVAHEHDLRGAVERPGARGSSEVRAIVQLLLDALAPGIRDAGLDALVVDSGPVRWSSQFARAGATLHLDPWEATRVLLSRRTADEIRVMKISGDVEPYLPILDAHSPLPLESLGEQ